MSDAKDENRFGRIADSEKNAVVTNTDAPQVCAAGQFRDTRRSRVMLKGQKILCHSGSRFGFLEDRPRARHERLRRPFFSLCILGQQTINSILQIGRETFPIGMRSQRSQKAPVVLNGDDDFHNFSPFVLNEPRGREKFFLVHTAPLTLFIKAITHLPHKPTGLDSPSKANRTILSHPAFCLRDRVNVLAHFSCNDSLDVDIKAFGERTEAIRTVSCKVHRENRDRRSWKTGLTHDMADRCPLSAARVPFTVTDDGLRNAESGRRIASRGWQSADSG
ncbi:MAG TPA: hypothetical protein VFS39_10905 [Nitrospira sp.]|nr:hypothetical protein [Nitrospira sp.]